MLYWSPLCRYISLPRVLRHKTDHFIDMCHCLGRQLLDSHHGDPRFHLKVVCERSLMDTTLAKFFPDHCGFSCHFHSTSAPYLSLNRGSYDREFGTWCYSIPTTVKKASLLVGQYTLLWTVFCSAAMWSHVLYCTLVHSWIAHLPQHCTCTRNCDSITIW